MFPQRDTDGWQEWCRSCYAFTNDRYSISTEKIQVDHRSRFGRDPGIGVGGAMTGAPRQLRAVDATMLDVEGVLDMRSLPEPQSTDGVAG
jgi:hypothetical protein